MKFMVVQFFSYYALICLVFGINVRNTNHQPQQVHISFGETSSEILVTWVTTKKTEFSVVNYGENTFENSIDGSSILYTDEGPEKRKFWNHRTLLTQLKPNTTYVYNCGSKEGWSSKFSFKTVPDGTDWPVRLALYGDLGYANAQSLSRLQLETQEGKYDAIIHVGDFAYDMDTNNSRIGDKFMETIEPIAGFVPYMVCPGNHEQKYNFSNYRTRFSMPNHEVTENLFYSWDLGPVHFVSINTEAYYYVQYGLKLLTKQYQWLKNDLKVANSYENRIKRPWVILYGHRPMYCSTTDGDNCSDKWCVTRVGYPLLKIFGMEKLLLKYKVNLAVWAHEHAYERLWPLYNYKVLNGSYEYPYTNPRGPVHITTGSAGCKERVDNFTKKKPYWSAFRSNDYGYTKLSVLNKTHLHLQQVSDDKDGQIIDDFWIINDENSLFEEADST